MYAVNVRLIIFQMVINAQLSNHAHRIVKYVQVPQPVRSVNKVICITSKPTNVLSYNNIAKILSISTVYNVYQEDALNVKKVILNSITTVSFKLKFMDVRKAYNKEIIIDV